MSMLAVKGGKPIRSSPFPRWPHVDEQDVSAVAEVVRSGNWWMYSYESGEFGGVTAGSSRVEAFEKAFSEMQHARYAIATASGSASLEIACRAIGLKPGEEVITTPYSFVATITCVLNAMAIPVFVDIDPDSYNINPELVEGAITERTRAIIPVHFGGNVADMSRLGDIAKRHNLSIIEDAAHAHGASLKGNRWAGTLSDIGVFSFQQSKLLTCGEGGMITTEDQKLADLAWSLRHYGRTKTGLWYEHFRLGWHYRMTEMQGALLLSQLKKMPMQQRLRSENAHLLVNELKCIPGVKPAQQHPETDQEAFYILILRCDAQEWEGIPRDRIVDALRAEGIPCASGYAFPLYRNPMFDNLDFNSPKSPYRIGRDRPINFRRYAELCPVAERACSEESIWITQDMLLGTKEDTLDIARAFEKVYRYRQELK